MTTIWSQMQEYLHNIRCSFSPFQQQSSSCIAFHHYKLTNGMEHCIFKPMRDYVHSYFPLPPFFFSLMALPSSPFSPKSHLESTQLSQLPHFKKRFVLFFTFFPLLLGHTKIYIQITLSMNHN